MGDALRQDLVYSFRSIRRSPGLVAVVITIVALAIGENTGLFSVFNGVVLKTLPVRDPHRLVVLTPASQRVTGTQMIFKATLDALHDSQRVFGVWLSTVFAGVAILLSCMGIYAVFAFLVARRTRDRGAHRAGRNTSNVLAAVTRQGLSLAAAGVAIGVPCALVNDRFIRSTLHDVSATDPLAIIGASLAFIVAAVVAGILPAYRASAIDPVAALRQD